MEYREQVPKPIKMDSLEQRMARAREHVPPSELLGYTFIPTPHGFVVKAIIQTELGIYLER